MDHVSSVVGLTHWAISLDEMDILSSDCFSVSMHDNCPWTLARESVALHEREGDGFKVFSRLAFNKLTFIFIQMHLVGNWKMSIAFAGQMPTGFK